MIKKLTLVLFAIITLASCSKETPKNYATFSGKLANNKDSLLTITGKKGLIKTIKINADGTFKDTLKIEKPEVFTLQTSSRNRAPIYLKNNDDLVLQGDVTNFMKSFKYTGKGADSNNFILSQFEFGKNLGSPMDLFSLDKVDFDKKLSFLKNGLDSINHLYKKADSTLIADAKKQNKQMIAYFTANYDQQHKIALANLEAKKKLAKGMPSPKFKNYKNVKGGKTSLDHLKGKYVYIDLWATWCGPCKAEIPSLKKIEEEFHGKNIAFVSISIDNDRTAGSWENAEKKWRAMVKDKKLSGIQLFAGKDIDFVKQYQVTGIPRFILIDPKGNILDANAPRPSNPNLKEVFKSLGI